MPAAPMGNNQLSTILCMIAGMTNSQPKFSIIIPARNEEAFIGRCLDSIVVARTPYPSQVEIIVAINRCTDRTEEIARSYGATICHTEVRNLAAIRNVAATRAKGEMILTIDADSWMTPNMLTEIERALKSGKYIGGGVLIRPERLSLGLLLTGVVLGVFVLRHRISGGLFWCYRKDFIALNGFDEGFVSVEDVDFAKRLRKSGKMQGKRFKTLWRAWIWTSCRKWDRFGDWYLLKNVIVLRKLLAGKDQAVADKFYYDFER
jgi:glycosyltransferase involved in cell wall biosynthesis